MLSQQQPQIGSICGKIKLFQERCQSHWHFVSKGIGHHQYSDGGAAYTLPSHHQQYQGVVQVLRQGQSQKEN